MDKFDRCPLCSSRSILFLKGYETNFLARCSACSFVFYIKIPSEEVLFNYYSSYPFINSISKVTIKRYEKLLDQFEKYRRTNNIIDIGCGEGFFLEQALKRGWNVYGTEYSVQYIAQCEKKGIRMKPGRFNPSDYMTESFDVIISIEVLEHINYALSEMNNFKNILRKGGVIYITTPNFNSLSRKILKSNWSIISYPEHLSYFTPQTMKKLISLSGLQTHKIITTGISIARMKSGILRKEKSKEMKSVVACATNEEQAREVIEKNIILRWIKSFINALLTLTGSGDTIKVFAQKSEG